MFYFSLRPLKYLIYLSSKIDIFYNIRLVKNSTQVPYVNE